MHIGEMKVHMWSGEDTKYINVLYIFSYPPIHIKVDLSKATKFKLFSFISLVDIES